MSNLHYWRSEARELGLASMLVCVVMVFLLCNFPAMVVNILEVGRESFVILIHNLLSLTFIYCSPTDRKIVTCPTKNLTLLSPYQH